MPNIFPPLSHREMGGYTSNIFVKQWKSEFLQKSICAHDNSSAERKNRACKVKGSDIQDFLRASDNPPSPCVLRQILEFCKGADLGVSTTKIEEMDQASRVGWLDDRCRSSSTESGNFRRYAANLTPIQLHNALSQKVCASSKTLLYYESRTTMAANQPFGSDMMPPD